MSHFINSGKKDDVIFWNPNLQKKILRRICPKKMINHNITEKLYWKIISRNFSPEVQINFEFFSIAVFSEIYQILGGFVIIFSFLFYMIHKLLCNTVNFLKKYILLLYVSFQDIGIRETGIRVIECFRKIFSSKNWHSGNYVYSGKWCSGNGLTRKISNVNVYMKYVAW